MVPRVAVGVVVVGCMLPGTSAAQQRLTLRFVPRVDAPVVIAFQTHTRTSGPTGQTIEFADLGWVTNLSLGQVDGAEVLHLRYDSVRIRTREGESAWRERIPPKDAPWIQVRVDDRLRVVAASDWQHSALTDPIGLVTGVRGLELPDRTIEVGDRWQTQATIALPGLENAEMQPVLDVLAQAAVTFDSLSVRPYDTVGFFSLHGAIRRTTVVDPLGHDRATWSFMGDVMGSLVWSTGWNAFVSGTTRSQIQARRTAPGGRDEKGETFDWATTTRYRVQP